MSSMMTLKTCEQNCRLQDSAVCSKCRRRSSVKNPHLEEMKVDILYHLGLTTSDDDLQIMFGDVKFVCVGGTPERMKEFAEYVFKVLGRTNPKDNELCNISKSSRYSLFKAGPVLCVSVVLGEKIQRPSTLDEELSKELKIVADKYLKDCTVVVGKTMCADDFYEGQGRLDGAFCEYTQEDKVFYLKKLKEEGVVNIEMESLTFAAMCNTAGVKGGVICVTLLDRLKDDQVTASSETLKEWQLRVLHLAAYYVKAKLTGEI
ncbi:uridine phosphorylase 2-like isoform X4 [Stegodyphus dumicola]|uniref:uridine phosphorylase 2-like isoform X4 n=1 Tax=Stegodyphus dumicola TaxID=202533 RepID=UPI0015ADECC2|nr:uridine phosphorylase 2-like isoform X4 [Stegodyphus dumicola]